MTRAPSSRRVLVVSFLIDVFDVVSNLVVALFTGSAVVFSEMAQGIADSSGSAMLVIGERRSRRPRDAAHPFGYAREAFFWGMLSAITMLVIGAGFSAWRGYQQLVNPSPIDEPRLAIAILALAVATNSYSLSLSLRKVRSSNGSLRGALRDMNQPLVKSALLRDSIGTFLSVVSLAALVLYSILDMPLFDALGALAAAVMMVVASVALLVQARALITGQSVPAPVLEQLKAAVAATPGVEAVNRLVAVYAGTSQVLVEADLDLEDSLDTNSIEALLGGLEARARQVEPNLDRVRVILSSASAARSKR